MQSDSMVKKFNHRPGRETLRGKMFKREYEQSKPKK